MATVLDRILAAKRAEVAAARAAISPAQMERRAADAPAPRGFIASVESRIAAGGVGVIAEIKRASPSRGLIRADFDPARIAASYERHGAACLSVLTDRDFFGGSREDLIAARAACALPVLRKDFMLETYQVHEARSWGADCILLILDAAPDVELLALEREAHALGMDVLLECHDAEQVGRAGAFSTPLVGINNRDLRTFTTRLETTLELLPLMPAGKIAVTESGIAGPDDVAKLHSSGVSAYLVGSAFMGAPDPGNELARVFKGVLGV